MNDIIVCSGFTHRAGLLDEYEQQLAAQDIPFHLEPLGHLPHGANSINMARRINFVRSLALQFTGRYRKMVITDAWDVLFYGTKAELIAKVPDTLIVSAERNCYPEAEYGPRIDAFYGDRGPHGQVLVRGVATPWRYANNGMMAGSPEYLSSWCDRAERTPNLDILDQAWFNRRRSEGSELTPLDERTELFYVVSATLENGELQLRNGRPWNSLCHTYPCFFHFSGQCPTDRFRMLMRGV